MRSVPIILIVTIAFLAPAVAQDKADASQILQVLQSWQTRLNLTEEQKDQTKKLLEEIRQKLQPMAEKVEAGEEVDKKAAIAEIQAVRKSFDQSFTAILDDGQKKEWNKVQGEFHGFMMKSIGAKRAAKLQQQYGLSDLQVQACIPVLAKQTDEFISFYQQAQESKAGGKAAGGRRARRAKLKQARALKGIGEDADKELEKIFTPEQWQKYEADKEKRKAQMKQKVKN
ncbi:MAG: hypothetical protein JRK53_24975 [Deltaproteobacteria bacterium]|nr:hypothetical protein [Deltaproteobacteria bacterium]